jgi:hypothetical protein
MREWGQDDGVRKPEDRAGVKATAEITPTGTSAQGNRTPLQHVRNSSNSLRKTDWPVVCCRVVEIPIARDLKCFSVAMR